MLLRSVCGSLAAVGVIGGLAAALPEHGSPRMPTPAAAPTFGDLPKTLITLSSAQPGLDAALDRQSLIRLAAYSLPAASAPQTGTVAAQPSPPPISGVTTSAAAADAVPPITLVDTNVDRANPEGKFTAAAVAEPVASPSQSVSDHPVVAAIPPSSPPLAGTSAVGKIDINHASVAELDRLPGGGRIGIAIARRRPYGSVDDLVRKRVLRASTFARIRSAVTAD